MKKACIFTFHNVPNYGAVLQTYALAHYIEANFGYHVDIMDFQCEGNGSEFEPTEYIKIACKSKKKIVSIYKKMMMSLYFEKGYRRKYLQFQEFKKRNLSVIPYDMAHIYDAVVLGSDQIWNPDITGGFQAEFFGQSKLIKGRTNVAYAASCGDVSALSEAQTNDLIEYTSKLDYVGVREKSLSVFLHEKGVNNTCTLDPTFLLSANDYNTLVQDKARETDPYILVYELQKNEEMEKLAFRIANEKNLKVRMLVGYISYSRKKSYEIRDAGPTEFLSLIKNADYILTNSFHGTAFSLIYKKDFNVVLPSTRTSRVIDLLNEIGLMNRIVAANECELNFEHIDYETIEDSIRKIEVSSKSFLREALGGDTD